MTMKRIVWGVLALVLALCSSGVFAQVPVVNPGWDAFVIRNATTSGNPPVILDNDVWQNNSLEFGITESGQKAGLATDVLNGATISQIATLHVDRLDDVPNSGSLYGPYFNIWVTDGSGHYAVLANEPSDAEWAGSTWDVPDWDFLKTKRCKVYETPGASGGEPGTSWIYTLFGIASGLTFEDVGSLVIAPPPVAYIQNVANGVGSGAPDEIGTDVAHGYTWVFGDTASNYVTNGGFVVNNYSATSALSVHNVTHDTYFSTIEGALAVAVTNDVITAENGIYSPPGTLNFNIPLTFTGASEAGVVIDIPTAGSYGISVAASYVTLENFTLVPNTSNTNFPIHASGTSNPPNGFDDLTIRNATIAGAHQRTGFDIHGFNNVTLSHLTSSDATGGIGVAVTGCVGVDMDNITTANNAWGSIAIYCSNSSYLDRGSDDVAIDGNTLNLGEKNLFSQDEFGLHNTNISIPGYEYLVRNMNFRPDAAGFTMFQDTFSDASALALGLESAAVGSYILTIADGNATVIPGLTIQAAIDGVDAGKTVNVLAGDFAEQLWIDNTKDGLTLAGAGVDATVVQGINNMPLSYGVSSQKFPIIGVIGAANVNIHDLTVDGLGLGNTNDRYEGIGYSDASGSLTNLHVTNVQETPFSGDQTNFGVHAWAGYGTPRTFNMTDVLVDHFEKDGIILWGPDLTCNFLRVTVVGEGPTGVNGQNGIDFADGITLNAVDCDVSNLVYTGATWTASGILARWDTTANLDGCSLTGCQTSVVYQDANGEFKNGSVSSPVGDAVYLYSTGAKAQTSDRPRPWGADDQAERKGAKSAVNVTLTDCTITGTGATDSWGVSAYGSGPVDLTMNGCDVTSWDWGVVCYDFGGATINSTSRNNQIHNNTSYGFYTNTPNDQDALHNWWGDASGPLDASDDTATGGYFNPAGQGDAVTDMVLYNPWIGLASAEVSPSATGPLTCGQDVTLTFNLVTDDHTPDVFGFNATVRATSEVNWGAIASLAPFGTTTQFFEFDNGDGSHTISGTTQGNPTQPISGAGTTGLFTIVFTTAGDGVADITFDSFVLRDPNNQPIAASATGATIEVDCTPPTAVTDITADPHHGKVAVTWNHDGLDVDHYEIYRGLWYDTTVGTSAYPEYDDLAGDVEPTRPADRSAAQASTEWELAGTATAGTLAFDDVGPFTAGRGVYYYEVFAVDAATPGGNNSPAAAANDRATNYWLGDIDADGQVDAINDITALAAAFGTAEADGTPPYNAFCDVGPTDDWSRVGIPLTDSKIDFEDLMVFTMNFGVVSPSNKSEVVISSTAGLSWIDYGQGRYALRLNDATGLKGVHLRATVPDGSIGSVVAGDLLDEQSEMTFLQNIGPGLDVNLAITGVDNGFQGQGDLFIIESAVALDQEDLAIDLRGSDNSNMEVSLDSETGTLTPRVFALNAAYPNPFNPMTKISFSLPETQAVRLNIYGVDGKLVRTLVDETQAAGLHEVIWNGQNDAGQVQASGLYFYRIEAGPYSQVRKMTLMK